MAKFWIRRDFGKFHRREIEKNIMATENQYSKGHFVGMGLAIGIPIGVALGLAIGNIALGPAMGLPIGLVLGLVFEKKYNKNPRTLTQREIEKSKRFYRIGVLAGLILFVGVIFTYIFIR